MADLKRCCKCGTFSPATPEFFRRDKYEKDGLVRRCKKCEHKPREVDTLLPGEKRCTVCKNVFPSTPDFFCRKARSKDGLRPECKTCQGKESQAYSRRVREREPLVVAEKHCSKCKRILPATTEFFSHNKSTTTKLDHWCRDCRRDYAGQHREYKQEYDQAYRQRPEYRKKNNKRNREEYNNRPGVRDRSFARTRNRRARKRAIPGTHTSQQIHELLERQKYRCYYCAAKFEKKDGKYLYNVDHTFPISRVTGTDIPANDISYLVLACESCNKSKGDKFPWEFFKGGRLL